MTGFVICCFLLAIIGCSQAESQIVSRPEIISVYVGQAAMLRCQILNPEDGVVSWSSVTYNFKIYQGSQFFAHDVIKYSLISIAGGQMYNLQILNVEKSDQGFYKCALEGTDQQIITQLNVLDRPSMLLPTGSSLNVTDCCLADGISKSCLPICFPSQIDLKEFDLVTNCGTVENLKGLSKCLAGGSNHDSCCLNMKVETKCLDICHNTIPENLSMEYFSRCYAEESIKGIFSCFEIGSESLPSEPTEVSAVAICDTSSRAILVKWSEPTKNPQKVTGYKIMYKSSTQEIYNSVLVKSPKAYQYLLNRTENMNLSDTDYKIHVSALADNGVSLESVELDVFVPNCTFPEEQDTSIIDLTTAPTRGTDIDTGFTAAPTRGTDRQTGDDRFIIVAIGVGVSMSVVCLAAIILLAVFFFYKARFQDSMSFDNPNFYSSQAVKAEFGEHSSTKEPINSPEVLGIKDNISTGKSVTDSSLDKTIYWTVNSSSAVTDPACVASKS